MSLEFSGLRRFLHWGPITALSIIKCITLTTLYMNSMWWPPNQTLNGFLNQFIFLLFSSIATFNYVMATLTGPGLLPEKWKPTSPNDINQLQFCKVCEGYKAPRSHHCRKCNRCIKKMDHHCPWINHCVGWANHAYFTYFLGFSIIGSFHAAIVLCCCFYRGIHRYWYLTHGQAHLATVQFTLFSIIMCIFAMGLAIGVVIALGMLLYFQLKSIVKNQTGIEMWIVEKAVYRRKNNPDMYPFVYPYDLGIWENLRQVFYNSKVEAGDGIEWPVLPNCDQYTLTFNDFMKNRDNTKRFRNEKTKFLTLIVSKVMFAKREQIAQKAEKRARTRTFKCIRTATGSYIPLISQGFRVCMSPPCTDEPRIRLIPGDIIKVTRFRQHWLFGERVVVNEEQSTSYKDKKKQRTGPIRGWFPRRCAIEIIEPEDFSYPESDEGEENVAIASKNTHKTATTDKTTISSFPKNGNKLAKKYSNGNVKQQNGHKKKIH